MENDTQSPDNNILLKNIVKYFQKLQKLQTIISDNCKNTSLLESGFKSNPVDPFNLGNIMARMIHQTFQNPENFWEMQTKIYRQTVEFWQNYLDDDKNYGINTLKTTSYQRYFTNVLWDDSFIFKSIKESYLMMATWLIDAIEDDIPGLGEQDKERLRFVMRQYIDAMNPRNFPMTNPEVIEEILNTNGENLVRGLDNLIHDIQKGHKFPSISMTDETAFTLGENIAATAGDIIFENDYMELIQYKAQTKDVFQTPLVIVPPWINKYYILDLKSENSFIKWLVDQGHTVFVISWVNPDKSFAEKGFIDYIDHALFKAIDIANTACGTKQANVIGYCIGGTLLSMGMAYLKAKSLPSPIKTATLLTTLLDFEQAGDMKVFIGEDQLATIDNLMAEQGILDGKIMKMTFSMLRAGDLIWSFVVNNYLMGRDPIPFDLLYWNNDSTNLPARLHHDYLSSMYLKNLLAKGQYQLNGVALDISKIDTPGYFLSAQEDHIAPWQATYAGAQLFTGDTVFTLSGSGHVAGVINPPSKNKYGYKTGSNIKTLTAEAWETSSQHHAGSWWPHWQKWIISYNKDKTLARSPTKPYQSIRPAPGNNVRKRLA